jgi:hypothetical protein
MSSGPPFQVLVNSSDGYRDCWKPFFTLLRRYWPEVPTPVVLNTLAADYSFPEVPLRSTRTEALAGRRLTWSEALLAALDSLDCPLVLYLQEDYFLDGPVDSRRITELAALMISRPEIAHIGLTYFGARGPFTPWQPDSSLWVIPHTSRYRISTQAGLWRASALRSYLHPAENGWMFEIYGTWRARRREDLFLTVARDSGAVQPVPYEHAGIVKGRWVPSTVALLAREGTPVDSSIRGLWVPQHPLVAKYETAKKLLARPGRLLASVWQSLTARA